MHLSTPVHGSGLALLCRHVPHISRPPRLGSHEKNLRCNQRASNTKLAHEHHGLRTCM